MAWYEAIAALILAIVVLGLGFAAFEKLLGFLAELAKIRASAKAAPNDSLRAEVSSLQAKVLEMKERLDEQAIMIDDLSRLRPILAQDREDDRTVRRLSN